jgi:hypothetical protein
MTYTPSLSDALKIGETSVSGTLRQYAAGLKRMAEFHGVSQAALDVLPADPDTYSSCFPKVSKADAQLGASIETRGWSIATYKQHHANGRRMVEHVTGALAERRELRTRRDEWSPLLDRATDLVHGGLLDRRQRGFLGFFATELRKSGHVPADVTRAIVQARIDGMNSYEDRKRLRRGAEVLDDLRIYASLHNLLPPNPIGPIDTSRRLGEVLPEALVDEAAAWIAAATTEVPSFIQTEQGREVFTVEHSDGGRGIFTAALNRYMRTALALDGLDLPADQGLAALLHPDVVERVVSTWIAETQNDLRGALSIRSLYTYVDKLRLVFARNAQPVAADKVSSMRGNHPLLKEGRILAKFMSAATERWCRDLLEDERKVALFEIQHVLYLEKAKDALGAAAREGLDLVALSRPEVMSRLPSRRRYRAKKLLRRARMFGVCAAYGAIGREGVPFRSCNMLALDQGTGLQTFFDHSRSTRPRYVVKIPNKLLKNGDALTRRNRSIPAIEFEKDEPGSYAFEILSFFIRDIRPLFPGGAGSTRLFPGIEPGMARLHEKTFNGWLQECSSEIGLPMRSHNFRHGEASIMINEDPGSVELIAMSLGDHPDTVRRYYAFLHPEKTLREMQRKRNARRAELVRRTDAEAAA